MEHGLTHLYHYESEDNMESTKENNTRFYKVFAAATMIFGFAMGICTMYPASKPIQAKEIKCFESLCKNNEGISNIRREFPLYKTFHIKCNDGAQWLDVSVELKDKDEKKEKKDIVNKLGTSL